jgi:SAM-dependent methyltransferase
VIEDVWSARADAYRRSPSHAAGADLDLVVEWAEPGPGVKALDVATGGGHVARRLREAGAEVVTADRAPGMAPDVVCLAEELPFEGDSFDVVTVRIAPHHYDDVATAVKEMARVSRDRVVIEDTLYESEELERVYSLRDPTHVACYTEDEWRGFVEDAGLRIEAVEVLETRRSMDAWLECVDVPADAEGELRELLRERIDDKGEWGDSKILIKARKSR